MTNDRYAKPAGLLFAAAAVWIASTYTQTPAAAQRQPAPAAAKDAAHPPAGSRPPRAFSLSITGLVRQPLNLTRQDLRRFQMSEVQINDVKADGDYWGVFVFRGVPLKTLLDQAAIAKESAVFRREMDLGIVARSRSGKRVLLSWGEVFYRNPGEIIVAYEAAPVVPHHGCDECHSPEEYEDRLRQLDRAIGFPKLVVGGDFYADRSLEYVVSIEVADLGRDKGLHIAKGQGPSRLWSKQIVLPGEKGKQVVIRDLAGRRRFRVDVMKSGTGAGYHGVRRYSGVTLRGLLASQGFAFDPERGFLLSAADGYRILISSGELFGSASGFRIVVADRLNDRPITEDGRFVVVIADDLHADRWLKAPARIDVVRATEPAPAIATHKR
jgi:hypothetical protein